MSFQQFHLLFFNDFLGEKQIEQVIIMKNVENTDKQGKNTQRLTQNPTVLVGLVKPVVSWEHAAHLRAKHRIRLVMYYGI